MVDGKLDAFSQLHLARKLSPALALVLALNDPANSEMPKSVLVVTLLSYLSDDDSDYVVKKCLGSVKFNQPGVGPVKIVTKDGTLVFSEITIETITELVAKVIVDNLGDFLNTALARSAQ